MIKKLQEFNHFTRYSKVLNCTMSREESRKGSRVTGPLQRLPDSLLGRVCCGK